MRGIAPAAVLLALVAAQAAPSASSGLSVQLTMNSSVELGAAFDVSFLVSNTGSSDVTDATAVVDLPSGAQLRQVQGDLTCTGQQTIQCSLAPIPAGASRSYALTIRSAAPGSQTVSVTVKADGSTASTTSSLSVYSLVLRDLQTTPAVAGTQFVASQTLVRSDSGAPVKAWHVACPAAVSDVPKGTGHPYLRGHPTRNGARVTCSWLLPPGTAGKYVRGTILASTRPGGMQTKYPFWRKIR
jgi:hypothetical protein